MAKLCPKGKAAAKRKFKVYPSAYANMYASGVCSGKITPGGKKGRTKKAEGGLTERGKFTDKHGRKFGFSKPGKPGERPKKLYQPNRPRIKKAEGGSLSDRLDDSSKMKKKSDILFERKRNLKPSQKRKFETTPIGKKPSRPIRPKPLTKRKPTRSMYGRGGGVCIRGMNKDAYGKNS